MFKLNNRTIGLDTPFTDEAGTQYPSNWLRLATPEQRAAIGITEEADPTPYDDRFWWGVDNPKDLEQLKTNWSAQIKDTTNKLLAATDWMVIRKAERNVDIPAGAVAYRAAVLVECDRLLGAIQAASDVAALATVVTTQNWPGAE